MTLAWTYLAAVSVVLQAAADGSLTHLAVLDDTGTIRASRDQGSTWAEVHRCPPTPQLEEHGAPGHRDACADSPPPASMAWVEDTLYVACTGALPWRWDARTRRAEPAGLDASGPVMALGQSGAELLVLDEHGGVWRGGAAEPLLLIARAPEPGWSIAGRGGGALAVAGPSGVWQHSPAQGWSLATPARACTLAHAPGPDPMLWLAGADGLIGIGQHSVRPALIEPVTGVAAAGSALIVARGHDLIRVPAAPDRKSDLPASPPGPAPAPLMSVAGSGDLRALRRGMIRRASLARWIPRLTVTAACRRSADGTGALAIWLWLDWPLFPLAAP